jgi:heme-degrading monooxygenase HmoA
VLVIVWEFRVRPGAEEAFERAYGPEGDWERLFARGEGWLGTELLRDAEGGGRYLTVDRWASAQAYAAFRAAHGAAYEAVDGRCGALTVEERLVGRFGRPAGPAS